MQSEIIQQIRNGSFDLTTIATNLNTSVRTIQRSLMRDQVCFSQILEQTRLEMLSELVKSYPGKVISGKLGFARPCAFYRFFRKRNGYNFTQYYKKARNDIQSNGS